MSHFGHANITFKNIVVIPISSPCFSIRTNTSPDAQDDTAEVKENSTENRIDVLINDSFGALGPHSGSALQVNGVSNAGGYMVIDYNDTPNDPMDDTISYYPPLGFTGLDTFSYTIVASNGSTDTSVVRVLVVPHTDKDDQPIAVDDTISVLEDRSESIAVLVNDSFGGDGPSTSAIRITVPPTNGTATVDTKWYSIRPYR